MDLVSFSIRTKGLRNFGRRLWTVFNRFGFSEARAQRNFESILAALAMHGAAPTFFVPAVVLQRHPAMMARIAQRGAEVGIHGYVHNDYRSLSREEQRAQVRQAIAVFNGAGLTFQGFRNPYLGWTPESPAVFAELGLAYDSNEAILHPVLSPESLSRHQRDGLEKSLHLFQAIDCSPYTLRPHVEGTLVRIPTSIPDDEMLLDRLRLSPQRIGDLWKAVMRRVYDLGGIYVLNLHPERGLLCRQPLDALLDMASTQPLPVWIARLDAVSAWWHERMLFRLQVRPERPGRWQVHVRSTARATLLARHVRLVEGEAQPWSGPDMRLLPVSCVVEANRCPCVALSARTPEEVAAFLDEQGFPWVRAAETEAEDYAIYFDLPEGLGTTRDEQIEKRSRLLTDVLAGDVPLVYFGCWPEGKHAALAITGDVDSVTIQDFFRRIQEVAQQNQTEDHPTKHVPEVSAGEPVEPFAEPAKTVVSVPHALAGVSATDTPMGRLALAENTATPPLMTRTARVVAIDPLGDPRWEAFLTHHPEATIHHHPLWLQVLQEAFHYTPMHIACEDEDENLLGVLPLFAVRGMVTGLRYSSLPRTPTGGPLAVDRQTTTLLLREAIARTQATRGAQLQLKVATSDLEGLVEGLSGGVFRPTYIVSMPAADVPVRFGGARNHQAIKARVNKATHLGVRVREAESKADLRAWYGLYVQTMRRRIVPPRPYHFFELAWNRLQPRGMLKLLVAEQHCEGTTPRLLAGNVNLHFGATVFYAFGGSREEDLHLCPNDALHWHAICAAHQAGYCYYDMGEVSQGNAGLARYKRKWGAEQRFLYRYYYPTAREADLSLLDSEGMAHRVAGAVWQHLPLPVITTTSHLLHRYF